MASRVAVDVDSARRIAAEGEQALDRGDLAWALFCLMSARAVLRGDRCGDCGEEAHVCACDACDECGPVLERLDACHGDAVRCVCDVLSDRGAPDARVILGRLTAALRAISEGA